MGRKGPRAKTKIVLKPVKQWEQLGNMHNLKFQTFLNKNHPTVLFCTVLLALYYQYCAVSTVLLARCYEHCAFNNVLLALCYQHLAISSVLLALCYQHCAKSSVLLRCFSTTWFNSGEFTLFWRALQNVAKYAFFVLLFWAKIFIRAIFYAFSISGSSQDHILSLLSIFTVNFRLF